MYDILIIGSGPAGYTAAIYASRANLKVLLVSGKEEGGQLMLTTDVENFPGFPEGILGPELMARMKKQAERFGTECRTGWVTEVRGAGPFIAATDEGEVEARTVILSMGASARWLGLESETRLMGKGISACATCDGFFFKGKEVVVAGGGDSAMEEANFLTRFASKVTIVHRRDEFKASKIMLDRARNNPKITFITNTVIEEILGDAKVSGVRLKNLKTGETRELSCDGVFMAIGHEPNTKFLNGFVKTDVKGYVEVEPGSVKTSVSGVFACGDVMDHIYRQAVTAAGTGCMAAKEAEWYLEHEVRMTNEE